jgi:hypothetical protein
MVMRTASECLAKASELEALAEQCSAPPARAAYLEVATYWRDLARRALIHEQREALPHAAP